jgi:hypothetical protein
MWWKLAHVGILVLVNKGLHTGFDRVLHLLHHCAGLKETLDPSFLDGGATGVGGFHACGVGCGGSRVDVG